MLSGLYYKYNQLRADASPNFLTVVKGKLYDKYVNGVWQNPYIEKQALAMTPPIINYNGLTFEVQLPAGLWYTNQSSIVQSIAIDFGNGQGYQAMALGQIRSITYQQAGFYEWKYKLTLTGGQTLYSHSKIQIEGTPPPQGGYLQRGINDSCTNANGIDEVEFQGIRTYLGLANEAVLEIDYANNDCTLRRPLIVAEGFDSGILGVESPLGENECSDFIREALDNTGNLPVEISNYDIIYVNWISGRDYLQRNAYLLQDVIKWLNSVKVGSEANVVLGQSMGGVIARYALRDMEVRGEAHQTSLYISHDAPHQGANIPLSIQYFARHMVDQFVSTPLGDININPNDGGPITIEQIRDLFEAPGTKQLLANYIKSNFQLDNDEHNSWQTELRNLGYPQLTRNVAISNGSHCASPQDFAPGATLFSLSGNGGTTLLTSFLVELLSPLGIVNDLAFIGLAILFDEPALALGVLPGNSKFSMTFNAKALPSVGSTLQIYRGKITFTKTLLGIINFNVNLTDRGYNNPSGILSYDYYPGGIYRVPFDFDNTSLSNAFANLNISATAADGFNFIPTPSALDVGRGTAPLTNNDYLKIYSKANPPTGTLAIPFLNFTTSYNTGSTNEQHISFNTRNGNWLAEELNSDAVFDTFDCSFICDVGNLITGPDLLCSNAAYSVVAPEGVDVIWSVNNTSAATISGNPGRIINLSAVNGYRTNVTLTATINSNDCGRNLVLSKNVRVGTPDVPTSLTGPAPVNTGALVTYYAGSSAGSTSYQWRLPYPYTTVTTFNYFGQNWQLQSPGNTSSARAFTGTAGTSGYVQVMGQNACGVGGAKLLYVTHGGGSGGGGGGGGIPRSPYPPENYEVFLYPNPAVHKVNVQLTELTEYEGDPPTRIVSITVLDQTLRERKTYTFNSFTREAEINVSFLKTGVNCLLINTDNGSFAEKLLIE